MKKVYICIHEGKKLIFAHMSVKGFVSLFGRLPKEGQSSKEVPKSTKKK